MRLAALSDIHANLPALEVVLDMRQQCSVGKRPGARNSSHRIGLLRHSRVRVTCRMASIRVRLSRTDALIGGQAFLSWRMLGSPSRVR